MGRLPHQHVAALPLPRLSGLRRVAALAAIGAVGLAGCGSAGSAAPGPIVFAGRPQNAETNGYGWQLMVVNADGTGFRRLTRTDGDTGPSWSPDGTKVVFTRSLEEESAVCGLPACEQIWVVNADGRNQRPLTSVEDDAWGPVWSPDGMRIVFSKRDFERETDDVTDFEADIYVMNPDGTEETRLADLAGAEEGPAWSPDGKEIAFSTARGEEGDIYVMNADGSELTRLTDLGGVEIAPTWSPDGERIAFTTEWIERADIYVINADGSALRRLTDPAVGETSPAWSPDGGTIAFLRESGEGFLVVLAEADGSDERLIHPRKGHFQIGGAVWSPDGKQLAFTADDQETIWVVDSDGRNTRKLWSAPASEPIGLDWAAARD